MSSSQGANKNLWASILSDISSHTTSAQLKPKNLIVLGDEGTGKSSFVARLQGKKYSADESIQGTGLEYNFLEVKDEESDDIIGRLGVYLLDGNEELKHLLGFLITKETITNIAVVIVVDMSRPWTIMQSLERWTAILEEHINGLGLGDELNVLREKMVKKFQMYTEPSEEKAEKPSDEEQVLLPLEDDTLTTNLGVPVMVVANKVDSMVALEQDRDYRSEHFDFIQMHMRRFALKLGATLAYSGKEGKNKENIYRHVLHLVYGHPDTVKPNIAETDALFIPSGWDNSNKINVLQEGFKQCNAAGLYEETITAPVPVQIDAEREILAEDEQEFLRKQQPLLGKTPSAKPETTTSAPTTRKSTSGPDSPKTAAKTSGTKTPVKPGADKNQDVLTHFFESLMNKKPGATKAGPTPSGPSNPPAA